MTQNPTGPLPSLLSFGFWRQLINEGAYEPYLHVGVGINPQSMGLSKLKLN